MKIPSLTPEAEAVLATAAADARRRGHPTITQEHLLAALVALEPPWPILLPVRFYRREIEIHKNGEATVATFPKREARERVRTSMQRAREEGFPLRVTMARRTPSG